MRYEGKISKLDQLIVSDPSYEKGIWCRYENDNLNMKNLKVLIDVSKVKETLTAEDQKKVLPDSYDINNLHDLNIEGTDIKVMIFDSRLNCDIVEDGFTHPIWAKINQFTIGMDTACVSIGANEVADKIRAEKEVWQPSTALNTLTDGEFGTLYEGTTPKGENVAMLFLTGYLDADTEYDEASILDYLKENLQIDDLHPVESIQETENELEIGGI